MPDAVLFHHATIHTMDPDLSTRSWLRLDGDRITHVGDGEDWRTLVDDATDVIDLGGATVLPGFIEAHGHPTMEMAVLSPRVLDLRASTCADAGTVLDTLRRAVDAAHDGDGGDWVVGFGWDPLLMPDLPEMSGSWLTELSPTVPVSVMHYSAHISWANQAALDRLGFTADTPDPVGSSYRRHPDGSLTGEALEIPAAVHLMGPALAPTPDQFGAFYRNRLEQMARVGVTTTGDLAFDPALTDAMTGYFAHYGGPVRVRSYEVTGAREPVPASPSDSTLYRQVGVKIWKDGSPWVGNIETSFPYQDSRATHAIGIEGGHRGCSNYTHEQLLQICEAYYPAGWQIACHVHGDVAVDDVLDVFEDVDRRFPREGYPKFRLEHAGAMTAEQVARAHTLGVSVSYFSAHVYYYGDVLQELFGDRAESWVAASYAVDAGMPFSLHNDPPVTAESPLLNIQTAVTRRTRSGHVLGARYGVPVTEALKAQTIYPAVQLLSAHEVGSLEPGKLADLVVLGENPLTVAPERIGDIPVLQTWMGGTRTYAAADGPDDGPDDRGGVTG